jgi:uncharacterized repeat protein (TIGR01451 family)
MSQQYAITELLPAPGAVGSVAFGMNDQGIVVGASVLSDGSLVATAWENGTLIPLAPLNGYASSVAYAVNEGGTIVGASIEAGAQLNEHGLSMRRSRRQATGWLAGLPHDLGIVLAFSEAFDIDDAGRVVGSFDAGHMLPQAFVKEPGAAELSPTPAPVGTVSAAYGAHQQAGVVGAFLTAGHETHAFLLNAGVVTDLPRLGGHVASAQDLNGAGDIVGWSTLSAAPGAIPAFHACLWHNGVATDLQPTMSGGNSGIPGIPGGDMLSSAAAAINEAGTVIGILLVGGLGSAFVWTAQDGMLDLNQLVSQSSGWRLGAASAIDSAGRIAGLGFLTGQRRAFLLTPVPAPSAFIQKQAPSLAVSGDVLVYTISYGNPGLTTIPNVTIEETLPAGTSFVSATGSFTHSNDQLTWQLGDLPPGASGEVGLTVRVDAAAGQVLHNQNYDVRPAAGPPVYGTDVQTLVQAGATSIQILEPPSCSELPAGGTITLSAEVRGAAQRVDFYVGRVVPENLIGSVAAPPYQLQWTNAPAGFHGVRAVAVTAGTPLVSDPVTLLVGVQSPTPVYAVTSLAGAEWTIPYDLNEDGTVVGEAGPQDATQHYPALWPASSIHNPPPSIQAQRVGPTDRLGRAVAINNSGDVVGWFTEVSPDVSFIWRQGQGVAMIEHGVWYTHASDINDSGQVVGDYITADSRASAFVWQAGTFTALPDVSAAGESSIAWAVNNHGDVAGQSWVGSQNHLCLWHNGLPQDADSAPPSWPDSMNDASAIVGASLASGAIRAMMWTATGGVLDLQVGDGSDASGINSFGHIVGSCNQQPHAWLHVCGRTFDLNRYIDPASGWVLGGATMINDDGRIVADGWLNGGGPGGCLLTPIR